ncbi:MAG: beta-ketoacyl synthase [Pseudomonadota bacterium]
MAHLPLIVGFGGINSAGRMSNDLAYQRLVIDHLDERKQNQTYQSLAQLMGMGEQDSYSEKTRESIRAGTLIRAIEAFDSDCVYANKSLSPTSDSDNERIVFTLPECAIPKDIPAHWQVSPSVEGEVQITLTGSDAVLMPTTRSLGIDVAAQLPTGFDLASSYSSRHHPRGLQMSVFAMSDTLGHLGLDWQALKRKVPIDQISLYSGSALGQLDELSGGGLLTSRLFDTRVTSKNLAFLLGEMPANFSNAYVLGNYGSTGNMQGACAGFLYNLRQGMLDIREGRARIAIVGASEAPITPEIMDGFAAMSALATSNGLRKLDNGELNHRRACRPFGDNCGFVIGESAQYVVLMDDELTLELGATVYGAVGDVFVNSDGFKKSISSPGVGNYLSLYKAFAATRSIIGEDGLLRSFVMAHGTGTPQNRVTESRILNRAAQDFGFEQMPVVASKSYIGHSIASSSGEQLSIALGVFAQGILPGAFSVSKIADDVDHSHLNIVLDTQHVNPLEFDAVHINSKGFGGNNATASILSPHTAHSMLQKKHGKTVFKEYLIANETTLNNRENFLVQCLSGIPEIAYDIHQTVVTDDHIQTSSIDVSFSGFHVVLPSYNPYE